MNPRLNKVTDVMQPRSSQQKELRLAALCWLAECDAARKKTELVTPHLDRRRSMVMPEGRAILIHALAQTTP